MRARPARELTNHEMGSHLAPGAKNDDVGVAGRARGGRGTRGPGPVSSFVPKALTDASPGSRVVARGT